MSHASLLVALDEHTPETVFERVENQLAPFREGGEWFEDGTRWDWWVIGGRYSQMLNKYDKTLVRHLSPNRLTAKRVIKAQATWKEMQKRPREQWRFIFGEEPDATLETMLLQAKRAWFPAHYAFLHDGKWHERERLGFFGCSAKTECEIAGQPNTHRCKAKAKGASDAYIVSWGDDWATWEIKFYDRFIKPLRPETLLVTVDYHI